MKEQAQQLIYTMVHPLIRGMMTIGMTPNLVTTIGFAINIVAAGVFIIGGELGVRGDFEYVGWGGGLILLAGLFDMLDGRLARVSGQSSTYGALFDSVLDRYSELVMFLGIGWYLIAHDYLLSSFMAFLALVGSMMVSYVRARAEGLGLSCSVGLMQRPERIVLVGGSALICGLVAPMFPPNLVVMEGVFAQPFRVDASIVLSLPLSVVAVLANYTAIVRLNHCRRLLEQ
ncbi:CDP-alcohol phosphatidyltransferase family protein [Spirosoma rigui]|uniref:CDP-alcohol phosphatidyltransferase family protein n=1 Tax=Spirosoma rigui TaxID=564064 RepID=UPI0009B174D5|nr:CDP-alcohol phosphatidyltransferase family protein [Spirosoma rigui]